MRGLREEAIQPPAVDVAEQHEPEIHFSAVPIVAFANRMSEEVGYQCIAKITSVGPEMKGICAHK